MYPEKLAQYAIEQRRRLMRNVKNERLARELRDARRKNDDTQYRGR